MPTRLLKQSICTSRNLNALSPQAEVLFYRLIVNCDDFGIFFCDPSIIRANCFPRKIDSTKDTEIFFWLIELIRNDLARLYIARDEYFIQLTTWEKQQTVRAKKSKFPPHNNNFLVVDEACKQLLTSANKCKQMISDSKCMQMKTNNSEYVIQSNPIQSESNPINGDVSNKVETTTDKSVKVVSDKDIDDLKESKKYPPEFIALRKQVFGGLKTRRGYNTPRIAAEAKAISSMLKDFKPDEILHAWDLMKAQPFWQNKELFMMSVQSQIHAVLSNNGNGHKEVVGMPGNKPAGAFDGIEEV